MRTEKEFNKSFRGMLADAMKTFYGYDDDGNLYDAEYWSLDKDNNRIHQKYEGTDIHVKGIKYKKDGNSYDYNDELITPFIIEPNLEKLIETEKSSLQFGMFENQDLIEQCILETSDLLQVKPPLVIFGKPACQPRNVGFFSDISIGYKYSTTIMKSKPLTDGLKEMLEIINNLFPNANFNGILINTYQDGNDNIGKHSDNEKDLSSIGVVAISYGAVRKFRIRDKSGKIIKDIPTTSGSIMWMQGEFQKEFTHEIPVEKKVKTSRTSFTFRSHN
jgi:alkylated DNA repair dioxygenase AlkB